MMERNVNPSQGSCCCCPGTSKINCIKYFNLFLLLCLVCFLLYGRSLSNGFLLDDYTEILDKSILHDFKYLPYVLQNKDAQSGQSIELHHRPVSSVLRMVLYHFFKANAFYYHLVNILLFAGSCFLFFVLVLLLTSHGGLALSAALMYTVHPINSIPVNFVAGHEMILYGIFLQLAAISFLLDYEKGKKNLFFFLSLIFFALALFTQEITIVFPVFVFLLAWVLKKNNVSNALRISSPYFGVALGYSVLKSLFAKMSSHVLLNNILISQVSATEYLASLFHLIGWYLAKLFIPIDIVLMWNIRPVHCSWLWPLWIVFLIAVFCFAIWKTWGRSIRSFALGWFALGLIPVSAICFIYFFPLGFVIEPHWFFFTQGGFFLFLAVLFQEIKKYIRPALWFLFFAALLFYWGCWAWTYVPVWKNEKSYAQFWASVVVDNAYALRGLGKAYAQEGNYELALFYLKKAMITLNHHALLQDVGEVYLQMNQLKQAKEYFERCLRAEPRYAAAYNGLGTAYSQERDWDNARAMFLKATAIDPYDITAWHNLADIDIIVNKSQEAIATLQHILQLNPHHTERKNILAKLAVLYNRQKNFDQSLAIISTVIKEDPRPESFLTLSAAFKTMGNWGVALSMLDACLQNYPQSQEAYLLYGTILAELEKYSEAINVWKQGIAVGQKVYRKDVAVMNHKFENNIRLAEDLLKEKQK